MSKKESDSTFKLVAWSGAGTVTGANFELRTNKSRILIDCGLVQGTPEMESVNSQSFSYDPRSFSALLVTHAHMDHIGRIPKLVKDGFSGSIYSTAETKAIAEVVLEDACHLEQEKSKDEHREPIYTIVDLNKALSMWHTVSYHKNFNITDDIDAIPYDAGHILGSTMYWITIKNNMEHKYILATGDLGNSPSPLLKDTEIPPGPDYLLMESVYGDRNHEGVEDRENNFKNAILERVNSGGTVLIPAFSIERTQIILSILNNMVDSNELKNVPIFLDSPLAIHVTKIYDKMSAMFNDSANREMHTSDGLFHFKTLMETARVQDSHQINSVLGPKIIIAGSGMSTGGRILSHEKRYLPDENTTVLIMGFQAPGTLGRQIEDGIKKVFINGEEINVRAKIVSIHGFSGHADSDHLLEFVKSLLPSPKRVFVAMGEPKASNFLAQRIQDNLSIKAKALSLREENDL